MKRIQLFFCLFCAASLYAQQKPRAWSVTPRVGVNFNTISGDFSQSVSWITKTEGGVGGVTVNLTDKKFKTGVVGAVDVQYQFNPVLGLSFGVTVESAGTRFADYCNQNSVVNEITSGRIDFLYTMLPVLLHTYVYKGLSVNVGIQPGLLVGQEFSWKLNGHEDSRNTDYRKYSVALPVGVSYDFRSILLDMRYCVGLTKIRGDENMVGGSTPRDHLHSIQLSVGYKL